MHVEEEVVAFGHCSSIGAHGALAE